MFPLLPSQHLLVCLLGIFYATRFDLIYSKISDVAQYQTICSMNKPHAFAEYL